MPSNTFTLIASSTVGAGGASSIDFTSIPSTYTDLCVLLSGRCVSDDTFTLRFNSSTTGYTQRELRGSGSVASSSSSTSIICVTGYDGRTANTFGNTSIYIPNYAGSNYKSVSADCTEENNATASVMTLVAGLWSNTAAITSVNLIGNGNFVQYSTAYLYGIKNS